MAQANPKVTPVAKQGGKGETKPKQPEAEVKLPTFVDEKTGKLLRELNDDGEPTRRPIRVKRAAFGKSIKGKQAFCDYQILLWTERKEQVSKKMDPAAKARAKADRMRESLKKLEQQIAALDAEGSEKS